jgi:hypothetical protein
MDFVGPIFGENEMSVIDKLFSVAGLKPREAKTSLRTRVLLIGPEEARALLAANIDNRKLRPGRVRFYADTMAQGGWHLTHQGIAFSVDGKGVDLQHRLNAIIESGCTVPMMVTEGLKPEAFEAIDQHERRSMHDALRKDRKVLEVAKFFVFLRSGGPNNPTLLEIGEMCGLIEGVHALLLSRCNTAQKLYSSVPMRAAACLLLIEHEDDLIFGDEVCAAYRALVLGRTEEWTPAMHAFGRQVSTGLCGAGDYRQRIDLFARGLIALDSTKKGLTKIQVNNAPVMARYRVRQVFGGDDMVPEEQGAGDRVKIKVGEKRSTRVETASSSHA